MVVHDGKNSEFEGSCAERGARGPGDAGIKTLTLSWAPRTGCVRVVLRRSCFVSNRSLSYTVDTGVWKSVRAVEQGRKAVAWTDGAVDTEGGGQFKGCLGQRHETGE